LCKMQRAMTTTTTTTSSRSGLPSLGLQNSHAGRRATTRAVRQRQISSRRQLRQVVVRAESKDDAENKDTLGNLDAILSSSQDEGQPPAQDEQPKTEDDVRALRLRLQLRLRLFFPSFFCHQRPVLTHILTHVSSSFAGLL
jgi:hypothetical protein